MSGGWELESIIWGSGGGIRHVQGGAINLDLGWGWGGDISHVQGGAAINLVLGGGGSELY